MPEDKPCQPAFVYTYLDTRVDMWHGYTECDSMHTLAISEETVISELKYEHGFSHVEKQSVLLAQGLRVWAIVYA